MNRLLELRGQLNKKEAMLYYLQKSVSLSTQCMGRWRKPAMVLGRDPAESKVWFCFIFRGKVIKLRTIVK